MPTDRAMTTVDEAIVRAPLARIFALAAEVERWPALLAHYRYVVLRDRRSVGGGLVEMSANRPFGAVQWPTWWESEMAVVGHGDLRAGNPSIRFRHIRGVTARMEVEWEFLPVNAGSATQVRIVHVWNGPRLPVIGVCTGGHRSGVRPRHRVADARWSRQSCGRRRAGHLTGDRGENSWITEVSVTERRRVVITGIGAITPIGFRAMDSGMASARRDRQRAQSPGSMRRCIAAGAPPKWRIFSRATSSPTSRSASWTGSVSSLSPVLAWRSRTPVSTSPSRTGNAWGR